MTISKGLYIFLGSVLFLAGSVHAEKVEAILTPSSIQPGDRAFLDIRLVPSENAKEKEADSSNEIYLSDDYLLQHKKIKVLDKKFLKDNNIPIFRYELTAYNPEVLRIPPIQIKWGGEQFSTESLSLTIGTSRKENDQEIRAAFDEVNKPLPLWRIIRLIALAVITYFVCWFIWPYLQKLPQLIPQPKLYPKPIKEEDPLIWLKTEMQKLKAKKKQSESLDLLDEWFRIVKTYFAKKEKKSVRAWTTEEFKKNLIQNPQAIGVLPLIKSCDEIKFSTHKQVAIGKILDQWIADTEKILLCGN